MALRAAIALFLLLLPTAVFAQATPAQTDTILTALQAAANTWNGPLTTIATELFAGLAVISFTLAVGYNQMMGDGIQGIFAISIRLVVYFGFWSFLLRNWGATFGRAIIASFQIAAERAGGVAMSPASVLAQGGNAAMHTWEGMSLVHPGPAVGLAVVGIAIFVMFAITAALMLLSLAKAFVTVAIGSLLLGFAGHEQTAGAAHRAVWMTIGAGMRLFMIELIAGLGATILQTLAGAQTAMTQDNMWGVLGLGIVYLILVFSLPSMAEHMAGGGGHARVGPAELIRTTSQTTSMMMSAGSGVGTIASAGASMLSGLRGGGGGSGSGGSLPPPTTSSGSGGATAASSAGARMAPQGARFTRSP
jgi:type IV secretion system protein TrbL